jgi:AraC-like DNA-binding protein
MSLIATLVPAALHVSRLRAAVRDRHILRECSGMAELSRVCDDEPVHIAVIDLYADGPANFEGIRQLKQQLPRLTVVAYVTPAIDRCQDLFDAGRLGVDGLILAGLDDAPRPLAATLERAESKSLAGLVRESLKGIDTLVADALLLSVARAHERLTPSTLCRLLAHPRRAVTVRLGAACFPPPQRLLTWGRLIVAAHMLEERRRSADRVAAALDFPSGSAFRNTCQRYLHVTPGEVRARGGAAFVVRALMRHVDARLSMAGESRSPSPVRTPAVAL